MEPVPPLVILVYWFSASTEVDTERVTWHNVPTV